jgi:hypothetical protein
MKVRSLAAEMWRTTRKNASAVHNWAQVNRRNILACAGALLTLSGAVLTFQLYAAYTKYAAYLDLQLANKSLQRPGGIYAAPRRISVGGLISMNGLKERLLRAGYQEGGEANQFTSGSFFPQNDTIEVWTNEDTRMDDLPEFVRVSFRTTD